MIFENHLSAFATMMSDRLEHSAGNLSPRAASILITLLSRGPIRVSELANICGTSQPTATRLIDGLVKQGLTERADRAGRTVFVKVTPKGRRRARDLQESRQDCMQSLLAALDVREQRTLANLLEKLLFAGTADRAHARTTCRYCNHHVCSGERCPVNRKATQIELNAT